MGCNVSRFGWWELAVVTVRLGFTERRTVTRLVRRLMRDGLISEEESCTEGCEIRSGRGERRQLCFLSPAAVIVVASHARTPEAAEFRREALSRLAAIPSNALPSPVDHDEVTTLRARVGELERRVGSMEQRQLALPFKSNSDDTRLRQLRVLVEALALLEHATNGALQGRGLRCKEILNLLRADEPVAKPFRDALEMLFGRADVTAVELGVVLRDARKVPELGLVAKLDRKDIAHWFVTSNATH